MSLSDKFSPSQIRHQKNPQKESEQLRQSLMQRAKQLKQNMYQQTNFFDYSINNLMNQTLKQIKKHKQQFKEKQDLLIFEQQTEQTKRKQSFLKNQLMQKIEKCKNRYKKHIKTIKNQRNRLYTDTNSQSARQNVEEMLINAKNKFKKEQKQKRHHSEIFSLGSPGKNQPIHTHNRTHNMITPKKAPKLYQKLLKVNQNLTDIIEDPLSFPQLNQDQMKEAYHYKLQYMQNFGLVSPMNEKKQIFISTNPSKKVYYSPYYRFPIQSRENKNDSQIETIISQRSVFVPIGKVIRSERKKLEINNLTKKGQNLNMNQKIQKNINVSKRIIQSSVVEEQRQGSQGIKSILQREWEQNLPSNRLLAKQAQKTNSMTIRYETNKSNFQTQSSILQSQKMSRLKQNKRKKSELMFEDVRRTRIITQFTATFNQSLSKELKEDNVEDQEKRQIKIDLGIKGKISLGDGKLMFESTRRDSVLTKPVTFQNSKFKGVGKGTVRSKVRYQGQEMRQSQLLVVQNYKKKLSKSINLDVRGNNVKLVQSIKFQKTHKPIGSNMSESPIFE